MPPTFQISKLVTDPKFQHRADSKAHLGCANPERARHYADLIREGNFKLQPVEVRKIDGKAQVIGGFHTLAAFVLLARRTVPARVKDGTEQKALWESLAQNKHGAPHTAEERREMIRLALSTPEGWERSLRDIAAQVGVAHETVRLLRQKMEPPIPESAEGNCQNLTVTSSDAGGEEGAGAEEAKPAAGRRKVRRGGKTYEMDTSKIGKARKGGENGEAEGKNGTPAPPPAEKSVNLDAKGKPIPKELRHVFASEWIDKAAAEIEALLHTADAHRQSWPGPMMAEFIGSLKTCLARLPHMRPWALCPKCEGAPDGCRKCYRKGWVTKSHHAEVLKQMRYEAGEKQGAAK